MIKMNEFHFKEIMDGFYDGPHATPDPSENGPIFLGIKNILENGGIDFSDIRHISEIEFSRWTKRVVPQENDIVFSYEATLHRYAMIPKGFRGCLGRRMALIRVNKALVDVKFLYLYFLSPYWRAFIETVKIPGATVDRISISEFPNYKIKLPPLPVQIKIASILSAYDELIENNKQRIKLLEEMAEEIYKEWFVRFRFPGYESAKFFNEQGKEVPHGTLGALPEGWEKVKAETLFDINIGKTPPREESHWFTDNSNGVKWVSIRDIGNCSVFLLETSESITTDGISKFNMRPAKKDTVILSFKLTVGKVAILNEQMVTNEAIAHFNIIDGAGMNREYIYCYLKNFQFAELGNTSSIGNAINSKIVKRMPIVSPSNEVVNDFGKLVFPMLEEVRTLTLKNQLLQQTRDLLLPRLISGKLSVEHLIDEEPESLAMAAEPELTYVK